MGGGGEGRSNNVSSSNPVFPRGKAVPVTPNKSRTEKGGIVNPNIVDPNQLGNSVELSSRKPEIVNVPENGEKNITRKQGDPQDTSREKRRRNIAKRRTRGKDR